ncbi:MAG: DivIVA domain-containing protein [Clostridia bacterium]
MLTPLDIENKKFSKQIMNGYSVDEVDEFLDQLTEDYEKLYKDSSEYKEKIEELEKDVVHYKTIEGTLQNTLVMAQSTAEEVKEIAKKQADQIIKEAEANARKQVDDLEHQIALKKKELEDVQKQFDVYKAKMESLLISQLELLKVIIIKE